ncbi:bifunctional transcriptional activator/DNA repair enzyme AdaA [Rhodovibrionaceae bacterium A322]
MLFPLPDTQTLYAALLARDPQYDGRAFVGVRSTGIFCRLTCPARKPKLENCQFFDTVAGCIEAGFRPCKRCHPLGTEADADPAVVTLTQALEADTSRRWREDDVQRLGFDPSTVRRAFKKQFGITFLEMARMARLRDGFETLAEGGRVIDAQLDAGFSSASAFRTAFAKLLGVAPSAFKQDSLLKADWFETPLGPMIAVTDHHHLHLLEFASRKALPAELKKLLALSQGSLGLGKTEISAQTQAELQAFFDGKESRFQVPLALHGSAFTKDVWRQLMTIPAGETRSYSQIAATLDRPSATRAVARANGANQIAIIIPCHRVLGADGSLTGYGGGLWRKQKLIELERRYA